MPKIEVPGNPVSVNHAYRTGFRDRNMRSFARFLTNEGKAWKETVGWAARADYKGKPLAGRIAIRFDLYFRDRRARDVDNCVKLLQDALSGIAYEDDTQIDDLRVLRYYDPANPRVIIHFEEIYANENAKGVPRVPPAPPARG